MLERRICKAWADKQSENKGEGDEHCTCKQSGDDGSMSNGVCEHHRNDNQRLGVESLARLLDEQPKLFGNRSLVWSLRERVAAHDTGS